MKGSDAISTETLAWLCHTERLFCAFWHAVDGVFTDFCGGTVTQVKYTCLSEGRAHAHIVIHHKLLSLYHKN